MNGISRDPRPPLALVLASDRMDVEPYVEELGRKGFAVCFFDRADKALTVFGSDMPKVAMIGPVPASPCLDLLLEDLCTYGVRVSHVRALAAA